MRTKQKIRVGLVVPHIFIHRDILPSVIFSPGELALNLAKELVHYGCDVTLFTPGPVNSTAKNTVADVSLFESELAGRSDSYIDLLKKHPFTFVTLARQVQSEIIAKSFAAANNDELDIVHIYTNEEDIALPFAQFCKKPVVFTHHDPFNFLVKYKSIFPKYKQLHWISLSLSQRQSMPVDTNWLGNIYHGLDIDKFYGNFKPKNDYVAYLGRIIEPKGVHLAINAINKYNALHHTKLTLKIAGKHYSDGTKDQYWKNSIEPQLSNTIEYVGYVKTIKEKQTFLGNARALLIPSTFEEPFGMVTIEALACGTPVIGLNRGATSELITEAKTGFIIDHTSETMTATNIAHALSRIHTIDRARCRQEFEKRFTSNIMAGNHARLYKKLILQDN